MASTNTITKKEYSNRVKIITCNMVCLAGSAAFSDINLEERGKRLHSIDVIPGTTGPTDDSDLALTDGLTGVNLMATNGTDIVDNATNSHVAPDSTTNIIKGALTLAISNNAVEEAETTVILTFLGDF